MSSFGEESKKQLATCDPEVQLLFNEVVKGYDCKVLEGHRGEKAQNEAYANGYSQLKWPDGNHNKLPSYAADVAPYPVDFVNTAKSNDEKLRRLARFYHFAGYVLAVYERLKAEGKIKKTLRWGGDWDSDKIFVDQNFHDLPHFELI